MKNRGIFLKTFLYTVIFAVLLAGGTAIMFSTQIISWYSGQQLQNIQQSYERLIRRSVPGKDDIAGIAEAFYEKNQSFRFYITDGEKNIVYVTPDTTTAEISKDLRADGRSDFMVYLFENYVLHVAPRDIFFLRYGELIQRVMVIVPAVLIACILGAAIFARQMTKPIKDLADKTSRMADLEEVPPPPARNDELGALARDVYFMNSKLKDTIASLEGEVLRVHRLEETQRYFFSTASHELKTPVAATSVLLEGMIENIGDYKDHPKYLRECLKIMEGQSKTISEILELVHLDDGEAAPSLEKIHICEVVTDLLPNFLTLSKAGGQRLTADLSAGQICLADAGMLKKVLSNVILNAIQNTPRGGDIRIWVEGADRHYRLCVRNTGAMIDENILPKLFDPFFRVDKARGRKDKRSGLGLTIVRKTLEAMGVPFTLENTQEGVLFWMDLPRSS